MSRDSSGRARPSWRAAVLVLAGVASGVFVGPAISGGGQQAVEAATTARWVNCPGVAFDPSNSGETYGFSLSYRTGSGVFHCALGLPHGATITAVRFHLFDADPALDIGCRLHRVKLACENFDEVSNGRSEAKGRFLGGIGHAIGIAALPMPQVNVE